MRTDQIDFISAYCDRWCERCGFTSRCSSFAVHAALAMCGDVPEAIELAVGAPRQVGSLEAATDSPNRWDDFFDPSPEELRQAIEEGEARRRRIGATSIMKASKEVAMIAHRWSRSRSDTVRDRADAVLLEAMDIAQWDSTFIGAKLARALHGLDLRGGDDDADHDPIQNDWNGSAKVALISLERSETAWRLIAHATGDLVAADLAAAMADLRGKVEQAFPFARLFKRPGFDEPDC